MAIKSLSVFFPAFNEEANIEATVQKAVTVLSKLDLEWEVIVVDDGSKDKTGPLADRLAEQNRRIKVIHQPNGGYGSALRSGFNSAQYDWIVYTDADGQFDFSQIDKFLAKTDEADYLIGFRIRRSDPFYRTVTAKMWAISVFLLFGIWARDIDCGFKMIKKEVVEKLLPLQSTRGAMINAELLIKAKKLKFRIVQIGVNHYPRMAGVPSGVKLAVIVKSYIDLFRLRMEI